MLPKIADIISDLIAELIAVIVLAIVGWLLRDLLGRLWNTVIEWLTRQWRYLVIVVLLILIEIALYLVYANWWIITFSIAHLALVMLTILLLFALRRPTMVSPGFLDAWTIGSLIQKIGFDYLPQESPLTKEWQLCAEGREEDLQSYRDSTYGYILRIEAEQDFCIDYNLVSDELKQRCKAIEFVFRSESKFSFYAIVGVLSRQGEVRLRRDFNSDIEGIFPKQHQKYSNEYEVYAPVDQLEDGWSRMRMDLLEQVRDVAALEGREWELELVTLRLRGKGIKVDVAYIGLYSESGG